MAGQGGQASTANAFSFISKGWREVKDSADADLQLMKDRANSFRNLATSFDRELENLFNSATGIGPSTSSEIDFVKKLQPKLVEIRRAYSSPDFSKKVLEKWTPRSTIRIDLSAIKNVIVNEVEEREGTMTEFDRFRRRRSLKFSEFWGEWRRDGEEEDKDGGRDWEPIRVLKTRLKEFEKREFLGGFKNSEFVEKVKSSLDLKEAIVKGLGFQSDDLKISGFDLREAQVGHSVAYEFDVEVDKKVLPLKLLEDVDRWEYVDLPLFRVEDESGLVRKEKLDEGLPLVLTPFQLEGPMEMWIQDGKDMRISLPHDVDAGVLKKVILAEGAVVTVTGARSVSLRHPLQLPLPLNRTSSGFASGLVTLAEWLRHASRTESAPLLSLRIVGPTALSALVEEASRVVLVPLA